jgi:two-component system, OmpR family, response regulator VicR
MLSDREQGRETTTVLVVDDETLIARILVDALEEEGLPMLMATNGRKALHVQAAERPTIVVTDFLMPVMNGLELAQAIKSEPDRAWLFLVLMSGRQGGIARARPKPSAALYDKPFSVDRGSPGPRNSPALSGHGRHGRQNGQVLLRRRWIRSAKLGAVNGLVISSTPSSRRPW